MYGDEHLPYLLSFYSGVECLASLGRQRAAKLCQSKQIKVISKGVVVGGDNPLRE